jgi:molecular chaperone Hsp33
VADALATDAGQLRRFVLEHHPVRGFWVRLDGAWRELLSYRRYPPPVERLLGEAVSATVLLAATLKFQGTLTLQLQGNGLVPLLVAQCSHRFELRAVARSGAAVDAGAGFQQLVGQGQLLVTVESEERAARYQGIVALQGEDLAGCLESYFATSEQLPTHLALSAGARESAGVLLQKMPQSEAQGEARAARSQQAWEELQVNIDRLDAPLLQLGGPEQVLHSLCGSHDCRLFAATPVRFACRCSDGRVARLLRTLGREEIESIIAEQGAVTVTCEFCGRPYRFDAVDAERLLSAGAGLEGPRSLN